MLFLFYFYFLLLSVVEIMIVNDNAFMSHPLKTYICVNYIADLCSLNCAANVTELFCTSPLAITKFFVYFSCQANTHTSPTHSQKIPNKELIQMYMTVLFSICLRRLLALIHIPLVFG